MNLRAFSIASFFVLSSNLSLAQDTSCIGKVVDMPSLEACAKAEIDPLQEKVEALTRQLFQRHKGVSEWLSSSKLGWDAYHSNHCAFQTAARTSSANKPIRSVDGQRFLLECSKRLLEQRIRELQAL